MQKAQRIIKTYRRNRMIVCTICALVTLASTLSVRFISQRNLNQQRVVQFANHAVEELDKVLLPLQAGSEVLLPLIGLPCSVAHLPLRKQAAKLQTVRSIGLVQDGTLYCSSIFGYRNVPVVDILAELPAPQPLLRLTIDRALIKGSPVLIQWTPAAGSSNAGVMEMINIDLLTAMLLEPQLPQISSASLTVDKRHLLYGNGLVDSLPQPTQVAPPGVTAHVVDVAKMIRVYNNPKYAGERVMLLFTNPTDVERLVEGGVKITSVNVGGMAFRQGKTQVNNAVSVDEKDIEAFKKLNARGIELEVRKVSTDPKLKMMDLISKIDK